MPPNAQYTIRLDIFLLIVRTLFPALVKWVLNSHIRGDFPPSSRAPNRPRYAERIVNLNLQDGTPIPFIRGTRESALKFSGRRARQTRGLTFSGRSHEISPVRSKTYVNGSCPGGGSKHDSTVAVHMWIPLIGAAICRKEMGTRTRHCKICLTVFDVGLCENLGEIRSNVSIDNNCIYA